MSEKIKIIGPALNAEQSARLWELGIFILSLDDQKSFLAGGLLVVDRRTLPLKCGVAMLPNWWLGSWCVSNNIWEPIS